MSRTVRELLAEVAADLAADIDGELDILTAFDMHAREGDPVRDAAVALLAVELAAVPFSPMPEAADLEPWLAQWWAELTSDRMIAAVRAAARRVPRGQPRLTVVR